MVIRSLEGDDQINAALNCAMEATLNKLQAQGKITQDDVDEFLDEHICMNVTRDGGFRRWWNRIWGKETARDAVVIATLKVD